MTLKHTVQTTISDNPPAGGVGAAAWDADHVVDPALAGGIVYVTSSGSAGIDANLVWTDSVAALSILQADPTLLSAVGGIVLSQTAVIGFDNGTSAMATTLTGTGLTTPTASFATQIDVGSGSIILDGTIATVTASAVVTPQVGSTDVQVTTLMVNFPSTDPQRTGMVWISSGVLVVSAT
jgi:hypothetical protein